jgi:sarcosine oxidase
VVARVDADVAVVGIGSMGSMVAWQLAKRGHSVIGFEQFGIGHDRSAVGGQSRVFRMAYLEGPEYVPLLRAARHGWHELEKDTGRSLLTQTGVLSISESETDAMVNIRASVSEHGLAAEILDATDIARRFPQHRTLGHETAVLDLAGGILRPEFSVISAVDFAIAAGADIRDRTAVTAIEAENGAFVVRTDQGSVRVRQVVVTDGPWAGRLTGGMAPTVRPVVPRRIIMTWFAAKRPEEFVPSRFPAFAREVADGAFFGAPTVDGGSVKVATLAEDKPFTDADALDLTITDAERDRIAETVATWLPGLHAYPHQTSVHMDGWTADTRPIIGALPGVPGIWLANGFSGHGFKMAPGIGAVMADLVERGESDIPISQFAPAD